MTQYTGVRQSESPCQVLSGIRVSRVKGRTGGQSKACRAQGRKLWFPLLSEPLQAALCPHRLLANILSILTLDTPFPREPCCLQDSFTVHSVSVAEVMPVPSTLACNAAVLVAYITFKAACLSPCEDKMVPVSYPGNYILTTTSPPNTINGSGYFRSLEFQCQVEGDYVACYYNKTSLRVMKPL